MPPPTDLIRRFDPILFFHPGERFFPSDAKRYLERCALWRGTSQVVAAGNLTAVAGEAGSPFDYLGRQQQDGSFEFLDDTPTNRDLFLDLAGWMPPTAELPQARRFANLEAIANRYADAADSLSASQFWYHAELFDKERLGALFANEVERGGKDLRPLIATSDAPAPFREPRLLCYYLFFPGHDEGLAGCDAVPSARMFASFAGEWGCYAVLLDGKGPDGPFVPRYVGLSMRNVGVASHLGEEVRVGMRLFAWEKIQAQDEHARLLVAKGTHALYLPTEAADVVKAFTPDDPGRNSCGLAEPVSTAMGDGTDNITAPPFLMPSGEDFANTVKIIAGAAGGGLIGLVGGPVGAIVGAVAGAVAGGVWGIAEIDPHSDPGPAPPPPAPIPGPAADTVPSTAAGPAGGKVVHPVGVVPPEAANGRGVPWHHEPLNVAGRRYDIVVDRETQILWAGDPVFPGYPGRWGPRVEADPQPRRAGMRFPKFWHMVFSELVLLDPPDLPVVTVTLAAGKKTDGSEANASAQNFTGFDFGTPTPDRQIFAGIAMNGTVGAPRLTSATIGGVAATVLAEAINGDASSGVYLIAAKVPNGAAGDIVMAFNANVAGVGICVWIATGASLIPVSVSGDVDDSVPQTGATNCPAGGAIFGVQGIRTAVAGATTWAGVTGNAHAQFPAGNNRWGAGVAQTFMGAQNNLGASATPNNGGLDDPTTVWVGVGPA
jgi:hypothetical protein